MCTAKQLFLNEICFFRSAIEYIEELQSHVNKNAQFQGEHFQTKIWMEVIWLKNVVIHQ